MASYLQKTMGQIFQIESAGAVVEKHNLECFIFLFTDIPNLYSCNKIWA